MKHRGIFTVLVLLFLFAAIFLINCGDDPKQEQDRIEYVKDLNERSDKASAWSHGPGHKYATFSTNDERLIGMKEETAKKTIETFITMPAYVQMIALGFTKLYFCTPTTRIELYADKKENCWKFK